MPRRSLSLRAGAALAALALGASLAACTDTTRIPPAPTDTGAAEPLFASDEEALAAAVEAYEEYAVVADSMLAGNEPAVSLADVATGELVQSTEREVEAFIDNGYRATAQRALIGSRFQSRELHDGGSETVYFYVCEDLTGVDILDAEGEVIVSERQNPRTGIEAAVVFDLDRRGLVSERTVWQESGVCDE